MMENRGDRVKLNIKVSMKIDADQKINFRMQKFLAFSFHKLTNESNEEKF